MLIVSPGAFGGQGPRYSTSLRGLWNRDRPPISARTAMATIRSIPRTAYKAVTTSASDHFGHRPHGVGRSGRDALAVVSTLEVIRTRCSRSASLRTVAVSPQARSSLAGLTPSIAPVRLPRFAKPFGINDGTTAQAWRRLVIRRYSLCPDGAAS